MLKQIGILLLFFGFCYVLMLRDYSCNIEKTGVEETPP